VIFAGERDEKKHVTVNGDAIAYVEVGRAPPSAADLIRRSGRRPAGSSCTESQR